MIRSMVVRNILSRLGSEKHQLSLAFVASVLLVRYLGIERLGQYSYVSTFASLFGLLAGFGLPILLTREVARDKNSARPVSRDSPGPPICTLSAHFILVLISGVVFNPPELACLLGSLA